MTESTTNEHESNESDEDCEVYFLKPVNEYNIVDKIKEANKVLFEETTQAKDTDFATKRGLETKDDVTIDTDIGPSTRKVTFAPNLEVYEPDKSMVEALKLTREFEEALLEAKELDRRLTTICAYETIIEETNANDEMEKNLKEIDESIAKTLLSTRAETQLTVAETAVTNSNEPKVSIKPEYDIVEEICEEIVVMDMENEQTRSTEKAANKQPVNVRRMYKMPTFDCAEEYPPMYDNESIKATKGTEAELEGDNKSMINLLTYDGEEECCSAATYDINVENSDLDVDDIDADRFVNDEVSSINTSNDISNIDDYGDDQKNGDARVVADIDAEDEDDDLSIIVASYLPNSFPQKHSNRNGRRSKFTNKSRRLLSPLCKRFNLHRGTLSRNVIDATYSDNACAVDSKFNLRRPNLSTHELTDLKLNYRTCCEYRRQLLQPEKLPKYTGYLSEYGLSRQQLELRQENLQRKQHYVMQQTLHTNDAEMRKMQDNERAFTTWLRNKMRFPINKTRNMFDVKRRSIDDGKRGGGGDGLGSTCGANSAVRNASGKRK